ncbi:hypothetical protein [Thermococcus aciditolerans]|uniref:CGP-CTERM sorting domain-containing protein n=1 Tax=Thermococcus aciditolerans TaxID=2598455 RepID=A0A5C0SM86_9EURY|nr:hypothetical protein [Thermococcus aciditolerans]QEK14907.1 hypothetical protein FPV09_07175 [Thermococcus aciditolerans]
MALIRKFIALLAVIPSILVLTQTVSADCSSYELYSVNSISSFNGWLLIGVGKDSYACEMIAGEWTPVLVGIPDEYYLLTDGNKTILLGGTGIGQGIFVGFMNETFYVLIVTSTHAPYRNVTITIEGRPHNFTLIKNVTVKTLYLFNGTCLENASTCRIVSYPNGTKTNTCKGFIWNASAFKPPRGFLTGAPVRIENGTIHFTLRKHYTLTLPEWVNTSNLNLEAFAAEHGVVLINMGVIHVPVGVSIDGVPLLFTVENGTVRSLSVLGLEKLACAETSVNTTKSTGGNLTANSTDTPLTPPIITTPSQPTASNDKKNICGPAFIILATTTGLLLKRHRN